LLVGTVVGGAILLPVVRTLGLTYRGTARPGGHYMALYTSLNITHSLISARGPRTAMTTTRRTQLPASRCPHCSGEFTPARTVTHCTDCGYIPGQGAD